MAIHFYHLWSDDQQWVWKHHEEWHTISILVFEPYFCYFAENKRANLELRRASEQNSVHWVVWRQAADQQMSELAESIDGPTYRLGIAMTGCARYSPFRKPAHIQGLQRSWDWDLNPIFPERKKHFIQRTRRNINALVISNVMLLTG